MLKSGNKLICLLTIIIDINITVVPSVFFPLIREGRRMLLLFFPPKGLWGLLGPNPVHLMGVGQGTPWMSHELTTGPLLMAVAATQGAICTSGAILGFIRDVWKVNVRPVQVLFYRCLACLYVS